MATKGVYVGRFCPPHKGHVRIIRKMIKECGVDNCLLVLGSSNAPQSLRYFFNYHERKQLIQKLFPGLAVVGLPDFNSDIEWLEALDDILKVASFDLEDTVFYGGSEEDIRFFLDDNRECRFLNRYTSSVKISATEIRDHLIHHRMGSLKKYIDPLILEDVVSLFDKKWEAFKKK